MCVCEREYVFLRVSVVRVILGKVVGKRATVRFYKDHGPINATHATYHVIACSVHSNVANTTKTRPFFRSPRPSSPPTRRVNLITNRFTTINTNNNNNNNSPTLVLGVSPSTILWLPKRIFHDL